MDKKLLLLCIVTLFVVLGMIFEPSAETPSQLRYFIVNLGQFAVILVAFLIGLEGVKFFSLKSRLAKSLLFISLGLLSWGFGVLIWLYYNVVLHVEVPYPSWGDIGFLGIIPLMGYGLFQLLKGISFKFNMASVLKAAFPLCVVFVLAYIFIIHDKLSEDASFLVKTLDVLYPLSDAFFVALALLALVYVWATVTYRVLLFKPLAIICIGLVIEAVADFSFSYTTAIASYYIGNWVDMLFTLAFFTIGVGMYYLRRTHQDFILKQ